MRVYYGMEKQVVFFLELCTRYVLVLVIVQAQYKYKYNTRWMRDGWRIG